MRRPGHLAAGARWPLVGLALSLFVPSTWIAQKYLGLPGVVVYLLVASLALFLGYKYVFGWITSKITEKVALWLAAAVFLSLALVFFVVYPLADSGVLGAGSDRDEALDIATTVLLNADYPYHLKTYLGNAITPMPGTLPLSIPFVLLGNSAYQNLFWLVVFFFVVRTYMTHRALLLLCVILGLSPLVLQEYVTGGDLLANTLYVLVFAIWTVGASLRSGSSGWKILLPAVLFGIALSSRVIFWPVAPVVFFALVRNFGWKPAVKYMAVAGAVFVGVTVPFYLYDPQGFPPLHTTDMLGQFRPLLRFADVVIPLVTVVVGAALAVRPANRELRTLLGNCAVVLAFPVVCAVVLSSVAAGGPDFSVAYYGLPFLFFGATASWMAPGPK